MVEPSLAELLREYTTKIKIVLIISAVSVLLLVMSLTVLKPGTSTYVLALFQLTTFVVLFVGMSVLLWVAHRG